MEDVERPRRPLSAWLPVVGYAALILAASSIPAQAMPAPRGLWDFDKLLHAAEYAVLGALLARALRMSGVGRAVALVAAVAIGAAFGGCDELYQRLAPGRHSSGWDVLADAAGVIVGALGALLWRSSAASTARRR